MRPTQIRENIMKHHRLSLLCLALCAMAFSSLPLRADEVASINGITYLLDSQKKVAYVTARGGAYGNNPTYWYEGDLVIDPTVIYEGETYTVKGTQQQAFLGCTNLTSVKLPNTVDTLGFKTFGGCTSLTSANIPNGVRAITHLMFENCSSLHEVTIPSSVILIEREAFKGCEFDRINIKSKKVLNQDQRSSYSLSGALAYTAIHEFSFGGAIDTIPPFVLMDYKDNTISGHKIPSSFKVTLESSVTTIDNNAFDGLENLESVDVSKNLTAIGNFAFTGCKKLTEISPLMNVVNLGEAAFNNCEKLTSISLYSVEEIKRHTFYGCAALENVGIGIASVIYSEEIAHYAFAGCKAITSFTASFTNPVFNSQNGVLYNKDMTELVKFPPAKKTYTIPSSVTSVRSDAFRYCMANAKITCLQETPPAMTEGENLFSNAEGYVNVYVPAASIDAYKAAWGTWNCSYHALENGTCTVDGITYEYHSDSTATVIESLPKYSGDITVPATFTYNGKTYTVTEIGLAAFSYCEELTSVTLPETLEKISTSFNGATALTSITIPENVTSVSFSAFMNCTGLQVIYFKPYRSIPTKSAYFLSVPEDLLIYVPAIVLDEYRTRWNEMTNIQPEPILSNGLYYVLDAKSQNASVIQHLDGAGGYNSLTNIVIPERVEAYGVSFSVDTIAKNAFYYCDEIQSISIPNSVVFIADYAFNGCSALTTIAIPENVTSIGNYAFQYCTGLTSIISRATTPPECGYYYPFGSVNKAIPLYVPSGTVAAYQIAEGWKDFTNIIDASIVASGFCGAEGDNLTWVLDTNGVLTISGTGEMADYSGEDPSWSSFLSSIQTIVIEDGVTSIGSWAFDDCTSLTSVTIGSDVTSIGEAAFAECTALNSIVIPDNVIEIGSWAFEGCTGLTSVTIGSGVTSIGGAAFDGCTGLTSITSEAVTPPTCGEDCFNDVDKDILLYVPNGTVEDYQNAAEWEDFSQIQTLGAQAVDNVSADVQSTKVLRNGQLFILRGDKIYTITGQIIK